MKIIIEETELDEPEVVIRGRSGSPEIIKLLARISGPEEISQIPLYAEEKEYFVKPEEVDYFLAENGKLNAYLKTGVYEAKGRLYEAARSLKNKGFIQINKSTLVNSARVSYVEAEFSGNYIAFLRDGKTKLVISRSYMKEFRKYIMEGR